MAISGISPLSEQDNPDQQHRLAVAFEEKQESFKPFERDFPALSEQSLILREDDLERMNLSRFSPRILNAKLREVARERCMVLRNAPYYAIPEDGNEDETEFVPIEKTVNGARVLSVLVKRMNSGRVSCTSYGTCTTLFKAYNQSTPSELLLLQCNVDWNNGTPSTPQNCEVMAGWRQGRPWVKAIIARTARRCRPHPALKLAPTYRITLTGIEYRTMRKSIDAVIAGLRAAPLSYQLETEEYESSAVVVASAPHRISPILGDGWREQVKISVDFRGIGHEGSDVVMGEGISVSVSIVLWLSRYNTNERKYWHPPEQSEEHAYTDKIKTVLLDILGKECRNNKIPMALNGSSIPCNVPAAAVSHVKNLIILSGEGQFHPVLFSHKEHQSGTPCESCHHNLKDTNSQQTKAVLSCRACHGYSQRSSHVLRMKEASHRSCIPCHEARGLNTTCYSCHEKRQ